ncbi:hypothetical protein COF68_05780 [Bacillus toyonensis]|uniref:hypothetical protein n=1 Tax=Bacillus toyonensis TaxID=155322 RepID=UPI000BFD07B0|nr:hypothetical protein [Bacillus toyonensis]PHE64350.1 hypothetical protein COF68_05780 [Bacillus toyonensis]
MTNVKTYRARVEEVGFISNETSIKFRHVEAENLEDAKAKTEKWYGKCLLIQEKPLASKEMLVSDMEEGIAYEIMADSEHTFDSMIFKKRGEWIHSTVRGGDAVEEGSEHAYKLEEVIKVLSEKEDYSYLKELDINKITFSQLEYIDCDISWEATALLELPKQFEGIAKSLDKLNLTKLD